MKASLNEVIGSECVSPEGSGTIIGYIEWGGKIQYVYVQYNETERRLSIDKVKIK